MTPLLLLTPHFESLIIFEKSEFPDNPPELGLGGFDNNLFVEECWLPELFPFLVELGCMPAYPEV